MKLPSHLENGIHLNLSIYLPLFHFGTQDDIQIRIKRDEKGHKMERLQGFSIVVF